MNGDPPGVSIKIVLSPMAKQIRRCRLDCVVVSSLRNRNLRQPAQITLFILVKLYMCDCSTHPDDKNCVVGTAKLNRIFSLETMGYLVSPRDYVVNNKLGKNALRGRQSDQVVLQGLVSNMERLYRQTEKHCLKLNFKDGRKVRSTSATWVGK